MRYPKGIDETVAVVGEIDNLGNWDTLRAVEMNWTEGDIWKTQVLAYESTGEILYKYICLRGILQYGRVAIIVLLMLRAEILLKTG